MREGPLMANVMSIPRKQATRRPRPKLVHQFLIVLTGVDPLVWRRIQVPAAYSFWDLHVAIQDAMGWLDYHLHEFRLADADEQRLVSIGIPTDDDPEDRLVIPGWDCTTLAVLRAARVARAARIVRVRLRGRLGACAGARRNGIGRAIAEIPAMRLRRPSMSTGGLWWGARLCGVSGRDHRC